jgi:DNA-binding Lrp family transcriptional regulator
MAKKLHASPGTVRNRIKSMYEQGVLLGSSAYPNPGLFGLKGCACALDVASLTSKSEFIEKLKQMDGILFIHNFHGSLVGLLFVYQDEADLQDKLQLFKSMSGQKEEVVFSHVHFPPCEETLTESERALISRVASGSFQSYSELARELKIGVRTLNREMARIIRKRAVLSSPTLDYHAIENAVPADLIVTFSSPELKERAEEKILGLVGDYLHFLGVGDEDTVYNLFVPGIHTAPELVNSVMRIDGVKSVRAELVDEHIDLTREFTRKVLGELT